MMVNIQEDTQDVYVLLSVEGEIDAGSSIHLDNAMKRALGKQRNILADLSKLEYISSAGLGVFISYIEEIKDMGIRLVLFGLTEKVKQVFAILGLDKLIVIKGNLEEAIREINEA